MDLSIVTVMLYVLIFLPFLLILALLPLYAIVSILTTSKRHDNSEEDKNQQQ